MLSEFPHGLLEARRPLPFRHQPLLKAPHLTSPQHPLRLYKPPSLISFLSKAAALQTDTRVSTSGAPPYWQGQLHERWRNPQLSRLEKVRGSHSGRDTWWATPRFTCDDVAGA